MSKSDYLFKGVYLLSPGFLLSKLISDRNDERVLRLLLQAELNLRRALVGSDVDYSNSIRETADEIQEYLRDIGKPFGT